MAGILLYFRFIALKYILLLTVFISGQALFSQNIATISGQVVNINNGVIESVIDGGRMTSVNVLGEANILNNGGYGYLSYNDNDGFYSPTTIYPQVKVNNSEIADIFFKRVDNFNIEMHFVFRKNESGFYTYFVVKDTGIAGNTLGQLRFALRVDKTVFDYAWTVEREGAMIHPDDLANYVEEVQDATYLLQDGSIYTKYDWCVYKKDDNLHGLMGDASSVWNIEASHEYINGGPTMQETTLHGTSTTPILLCPFFTAHFGGQQVFLQDEYESWNKIFGPAFTYINSGTKEEMLIDAKQKAAELKEQWPYQWLNHDLYPLERASLSGKLIMDGNGEVDSAMVLICKSGPSWELDEDHWQKQPYDYMFWSEADAEGNFSIDKIRPGTYTLYAYTQKGKLIDELRVDGILINEGTNPLGNIVWNANDREHTIFQIGTADHKSGEYKLADLPRLYGRWKNCPLSLTYAVSTDTPRENWYYCQRENSLWTINFDIEDPSTYINPVLKVALAGCDARPHLDFIVNGTTVSVNDLGSDSGIRRSSLTGGKYALFSCNVDASLLKSGSNSVAMRCYGSEQEYKGVMYDAILLEADLENGSTDIVNAHENTLKIYPNPCKGMLSINAEKEIDILKVFDLNGKEVFRSTLPSSSEMELDLSELANGIYFIQVQSGQNILQQKLILDK